MKKSSLLIIGGMLGVLALTSCGGGSRGNGGNGSINAENYTQEIRKEEAQEWMKGFYKENKSRDSMQATYSVDKIVLRESETVVTSQGYGKEELLLGVEGGFKFDARVAGLKETDPKNIQQSVELNNVNLKVDRKFPNPYHVDVKDAEAAFYAKDNNGYIYVNDSFKNELVPFFLSSIYGDPDTEAIIEHLKKQPNKVYDKNVYDPQMLPLADSLLPVPEVDYNQFVDQFLELNETSVNPFLTMKTDGKDLYMKLELTTQSLAELVSKTEGIQLEQALAMISSYYKINACKAEVVLNEHFQLEKAALNVDIKSGVMDKTNMPLPPEGETHTIGSVDLVVKAGINFVYDNVEVNYPDDLDSYELYNPIDNR